MEQLTIQGLAEKDKSRTPEKLAELGCHFVLTPDVFIAVSALIEKCLEGSNDQQTRDWLTKLKGLLETTTVPVKTTTKTA